MRFNGSRLILYIGKRQLSDDRAIDLIDALASDRSLVRVDWSDGSRREYGLPNALELPMPVNWKWETIDVRAVIFEVARLSEDPGWTTRVGLAGPLVWLALYLPWICLGLVGALIRVCGVVQGEILMVGAAWMSLLMTLVTIAGTIFILPNLIRMLRFRSTVHRELHMRGWM
jgi:hypothetical protein